MSMSTIRFAAISDTHTKHRSLPPVPECDVLIHAGDATYQGELRVIADLNTWAEEEVPRTTECVMVAGNHDLCFERQPKAARGLIPRWTYLQDSSVTIGGIKIWGSPWTPRFHDWAFNLDRGHKIRKKWNQVPDDTDLLVTHGPPMGYGDWIPRQFSHQGCRDLLHRIQKMPRLQAHVCGHIHEGRGDYQVGRVRVLNVSSLDETYSVIRPPVVFDLTPPSQTTVTP